MPTYLQFTDCGISPTSVDPGGEVTASFTLENPTGAGVEYDVAVFMYRADSGTQVVSDWVETEEAIGGGGATVSYDYSFNMPTTQGDYTSEVQVLNEEQMEGGPFAPREPTLDEAVSSCGSCGGK